MNQIILLIKTCIQNPKWAIAVFRVGLQVICGKHNFESSENELKLAAMRYNVDYHKFWNEK